MRHHFRLWASSAALLCIVLATSPCLGEGREVSLQQRESWILATTRKGGVLGFLGHRHAILAPSVDSRVCFDAESVADSWAELSFSTSSLVIDSAAALAQAGMTRSVDEEERGELYQKMVSSRFLAAEEHPAITYRTTAVDERSADLWVLTGELTIRGVTRTVDLPVEIRRPSRGSFEFDGTVIIEHGQFGMEPESIAGVVRVGEKIDIRLHLVGELLSEPCEPRGASPQN